jgi:3-oxoacyl-[acyl-carrier protein] reductase
MKKPFTGKKALVIGGTGGIGRAVAMGLARAGADLTVHGGSSVERLETCLKAIRDLGGKAGGFLLKIENPGAAEEILSHAPPPDILVCAWGPFKRASMETLDREFWESMVMKNLIFPGLAVSLVLPGMIKKNWGRILLFGGTNTDTIRGYSSSAAYSAAKTGLGVIAKSVAKSAYQSGIYWGVTCNVVCPGLTDTEYLDENARRYNREMSPGAKPLIPEDIAELCVGILENPGINGDVIPVDGGICL